MGNGRCECVATATHRAMGGRRGTAARSVHAVPKGWWFGRGSSSEPTMRRWAIERAAAARCAAASWQSTGRCPARDGDRSGLRGSLLRTTIRKRSGPGGTEAGLLPKSLRCVKVTFDTLPTSVLPETVEVPADRRTRLRENDGTGRASRCSRSVASCQRTFDRRHIACSRETAIRPPKHTSTSLPGSKRRAW